MNFRGDEIDDAEFDELDESEVERLVEYEKHLEKAKERYGREQLKRRRAALLDGIGIDDDEADLIYDSVYGDESEDGVVVEQTDGSDDEYEFIYEEESGAYGGHSASVIEADLRGEDVYNDDIECGGAGAAKGDAEGSVGLFSTLGKSIEMYLSGEILLKRAVTKYYLQMLIIIGLSMLSIFVLFWSLYIDIQYEDLRDEVQLLHERSLMMLRKKSNVSSYSAVERELQRREMGLERAVKSSQVM